MLQPLGVGTETRLEDDASDFGQLVQVNACIDIPTGDPFNIKIILDRHY